MNLSATRLDLLGVLVPNVDETLCGVSDEPGQYHCFNDQVWCPEEKFSVFECARFALVAIHHNKRAIVFLALASFPHGIAYIAPLLDSGNTRAT
jgi:hypothetical protein